MPDGVDAAAAETVVVNGVTALRMLHRSARVHAGQTIVVLGGADGGVGFVLVQLARRAGIAVIGIAGPAQQERVRALGAVPIDTAGEDVPARVRAHAPAGVAAVFDHVGGPGIADSWRMLAPGGTVVAYGTAATRDLPGNARRPVLTLFARLSPGTCCPTGAAPPSSTCGPETATGPGFQAQLRDDLAAVLTLLAERHHRRPGRPDVRALRGRRRPPLTPSRAGRGQGRAGSLTAVP